MVRISKTYVPNLKEKYMCEKHKVFFRKKLLDWKTEIIRTNNETLNNSFDDNSASADIVDQASSYTEKNVEMRAINRQIKLISKIDQAVKKLKREQNSSTERASKVSSLEKSVSLLPLVTTSETMMEKKANKRRGYE